MIYSNDFGFTKTMSTNSTMADRVAAKLFRQTVGREMKQKGKTLTQ